MTTQANETGQEPGTGTGGTGQESGQSGQEGQEPTGQPANGAEFDLSKVEDPNLRAYLQKVSTDATEARQEAAKYRTELRAAQQAATEAARANESAEQKAERERQERDQRLERLEQENRDLKVGTVVRDQAGKANALNPTAVYALIKDRVTVDDDGKPTNVDALLTELKRTDAYLFRRTTADAGAGTGTESGPGQTMNDQIRQAAGRGTVTSG
jgi:hypothetical protein